MGADQARAQRFRAVYEEHADAVARYAARRTDGDDVLDVVSETFLVAWRRFDELPSDALPWLFGTARRVISNRRRSSTRRRALGEKLAGATALPAASETGGLDERLVAAIAALPDTEREAFMLVAWDGLEPARAAQAAGCAAGTFRMRLHRARTQLKRRLTTSMATLEESR